MQKHNPQLWVIVLSCLGLGCEALEGERVLVPAAHVSLFLPSTWEGTAHDADAVIFEAIPRGIKGVKVQVLLEPRAAPTLADMQKRALLDVQQLAQKNGLTVDDITTIPQKRGHLQGMRIVHQLQLAAPSETPLHLTEIADLLPVEGKAVVVMVLGPKTQLDTLAVEIERIFASVRSLTPEPEAQRVYPPDAVTGASQRVVQDVLR